MKIAREIAEIALEEFGWINADGYSRDELDETMVDLTSKIVAKLEPARKMAEIIRAARDEAVSFDDVFRILSDGSDVIDGGLAMFDD